MSGLEDGRTSRVGNTDFIQYASKIINETDDTKDCIKKVSALDKKSKEAIFAHEVSKDQIDTTSSNPPVVDVEELKQAIEDELYR